MVVADDGVVFRLPELVSAWLHSFDCHLPLAFELGIGRIFKPSSIRAARDTAGPAPGHDDEVLVHVRVGENEMCKFDLSDTRQCCHFHSKVVLLCSEVGYGQNTRMNNFNAPILDWHAYR